MTDVAVAEIPRVYLVFNGPLEMSPGKMAAQAFQACQRLYMQVAWEREQPGANGHSAHGVLLARWERHTTTIARVAKTPAMFERVCAEIPGVVMVDEGYTEVEPGTPTVFASWPVTQAEAPKLLSNAKVRLL